MDIPGPVVLFPVTGICNLFLALGVVVLYETFSLQVEFLEVKRCNGVAGTRVGDLFVLFKDGRGIFPFGFSFRFLRIGDSKYPLSKRRL